MSVWPAVAFAYLTQYLAGHLVAVWTHPAAELSWRRLLPRALLFGPAAICVQMLAYDALSVRYTPLAILAPWWVLALLSARRLRPRAPRRPVCGLERAALAVVAALTLLALWQGLLTPLMKGDEFLNFAYYARLYQTHGRLVPEAAHTLVEPGHIEYPPLMALNEALLGLVGDPLHQLVVRPFCALAFAAFALLVVELCFGDLRAAVALPTVLLVLFVPELAGYAPSGLADLRLTATVLLLALEGRALFRRPDGGGLLRFAICAGACALTKNEGVAIATLAAVAVAALAIGRRVGAGAGWGTAVAILALTWAWPAFMAAHDVRGVYLSGAAEAASWSNLARLPAVLRYFAGLPLELDGAGLPRLGLLWPVALAIALAALARPDGRRATAPWLLLLALHLALYVLVFVATPRELELHLETAARRLFFHATPWLLMTVVAGIATLERPAPGSAAGPG